MQAEHKQTFKHLVYDQFARVGKALAHAHRLALLDLLPGLHVAQEILSDIPSAPSSLTASYGTSK